MPLKKTYFLAPTRSPNSITLGALIASPRDPCPLNSLSSPTLLRLQSVATTVAETNATREFSSSKSLIPSVFASFLSFSGLLPLGPVTISEASLEFTTSETGWWKIPRLETKAINPSLEDVRALFEEEGVQSCIKEGRFTANVYLVTEVQVASGGEYFVAKAREKGVGLGVGVEMGLAAGVPVGGGFGVKGTERGRGSASGKVEGAFVFAYAVREVVYRRRKVVGVRGARVEGDLMGVGEGGGQRRKEEGEHAVELAGLKEEDEGLAEMWDLEAEEGLDVGGQACWVVGVGED